MITRTRAWLAEQADGGRRGTTLLLLVLLLGLLGWIVWDRSQAEGEAELADQKAEVSADNATVIAEQVRDACAREGSVARQLGDLCRQAEQVAEEPAEPVAIPPTDEQLRPLVERYVAEWLARNPPEDGRDGITPSVETISALIVAELAENPPAPGEQGDQGDRGRPPTVAELQPIVVAAVAAHLEANPPPPGEDGQDGADSTVPGPPGEPPLEWTFTTTDALGQETTHRCVREDPFDPDAPTYTCTQQEEEQG